MRARSLFVLAFLVFPLHAAAEWNRGIEAYNKRDWATAAKEFEEVTKTNPGYAAGFYYLGLSQRSLGNLSPALASMQKAVELDPANASFKIGLGHAQLQGDRPQDAYTTLKGVDIAAVDAKQRSIYAVLFAQAAAKTNRGAEAVTVVSNQLKVDPSNVGLHQTLGVAYSTDGDDAKAFAAFKRAFELDPKDEANARNVVTSGIAAARRASGAQKDQFYTEAGRFAEQLANSQPTFDHKLLAGEAWLGAGDYQKALGWFDQAKAAQPQNALVHYYHAQCNTSLNELDAAIDDLQTALNVSASGKLRTQIYSQMGYIYSKKQDYEKAAFCYGQAGNQDKVTEMQQKGQGTTPPLEPGMESSLVRCPGFRDTTWGMTKREVIAVEGQPEFSEDSKLGYKGEVGGKEVAILFNFVDDHLVSGTYIGTEEHAFKNQYIDDFGTFKELLKTKYGGPVMDSATWENELYKVDPGEWGTAVSVGHLRYTAEWITDKTDIGLVLFGENYDCTLAIRYVSRELSESEEKARTEAALDGL